MNTDGSAHPALAAELEAQLRAISSCSLCNAIETTGVRLRDEGFVDGSIRALCERLPTMLGYAFTVHVSTRHPKVRELRYVDHVDWAPQLLALPGPRVLVIENISPEPLRGAVLGEVHASIYRALGVTGVLTNGAVRDLPALEAMRFHAFGGGVSVSHAYAHVVEVGAPVTIGGLTIASGDILHGDRHGVVSIPLQIAAQLPAVVRRQHADEARIIAYCNSAQFSVEGIEAMLQQLQREHPLPE